MAASASKTTTLAFVRSVWNNFRTHSGLEPRLLNGLQVQNAVNGKVSLRMEIEKAHTNRLNILHGGTIASIVDLGGSLAVASKGLFVTGVSTDLNVSYLSSGGIVGDVIRAEVRCDKFGKTLAYTTTQFFNEKNELFARGSHTKYIAPGWKDPDNKVGQLEDPPLDEDADGIDGADREQNLKV